MRIRSAKLSEPHEKLIATEGFVSNTKECFNKDENLNINYESALKGLNIAIKKGLNANIILAGHLDDRVLMDCKNLVEQLKISNKFAYIGKYTQKNAPHIYQKGDAYIMLKYKDPCPNTVIEAMACGLPILYSNSGGLTELVDKKFTNINLTDEKVKNIIKSTSFKSLEKMEQNGNFNEYKDKGREFKFFNKGPENKWEDYLDEEIKKEIEVKYSGLMKKLGYL